MKSIVFIHGSGVREVGCKKTSETIEDMLEQRKSKLTSELKVKYCNWGKDCGVQLSDNSQLASSDQDGQTLTDEPKEYNEAAIWTLLSLDPIYELRLYAESSEPGTHEISPVPPDDEQYMLLKAMEKNALSDTLNAMFSRMDVGAETKIKESFQKAVAAVLNSSNSNSASTYYEHVRNLIPAPLDLTSAYYVVARAVISGMLVYNQRISDNPALFPISQRNEAIKQLMRDLRVDPDIRGLIKSLLNLVTVGFPAKLGMMDIVDRKRNETTSEIYPFIGDILLYQTRGTPIRNKILSDIQCQQTPVILLAHSLGGIACLDLLATNQLQQVAGLITIGSQAPFFYKINALWSLEYGATLPESFPKWLNFYDRCDWLSYKAADIFHNHHSITDKEVKSYKPLLQAHSDYWTNPYMWDEIVNWINTL